MGASFIDGFIVLLQLIYPTNGDNDAKRYIMIKNIIYFNCTYVDADTHAGVCRECGHEAVLEHSYEYKTVDSTYHILTCKCGATSGTKSGHIWTSVPGAINYVKCKQCHYQKSNAGGNIPIIKTKPIIIEEETE